MNTNLKFWLEISKLIALFLNVSKILNFGSKIHLLLKVIQTLENWLENSNRSKIITMVRKINILIKLASNQISFTKFSKFEEIQVFRLGRMVSIFWVRILLVSHFLFLFYFVKFVRMLKNQSIVIHYPEPYASYAKPKQ